MRCWITLAPASAASASPTGDPFRYTGRRLDAETGLYYYRARYYSPRFGRFLQTDPIGTKDDLNLYAYTYNDPGNKLDPDGLAVQACAANPAACAKIAVDVFRGVVYLGAAIAGTKVVVEIADAIASIVLNEASDDSDEPKEPKPIETDRTGKVHGRPLTPAEDVPEDEIENSIDALDESIGNREAEQESARERGQNTSPDAKERARYRRHQDAINEERQRKSELERRLRKLEDPPPRDKEQW